MSSPAAEALSPEKAPLIDERHTLGTVTDRVARIPSYFPRPWHWLAFLGAAMSVMMLLLAGVSWVLIQGVGVWGVNIPVAWGFAIINFVWWIGIGHAGTLISAILLLLRQPWRTSINRFAEAMTLFAVANAAIFPLLHLGRPGWFYYLLPYPDTMRLWPQWRSPLVYDVFAVTTYALVSLLFWYVGLIPDLATMRDQAKKSWTRKLAGIFSLGWRGEAKHWQRYEMVYLLLAGLATPLVVSVHSIVSFDFAVAILPGWHSTIFPPYFVAGAIYSGFAMVFTLAVPLRWAFRLHDIITERHLNAMAKVMLASGLVVAYGYIMEGFVSWMSADTFERFVVTNRATGPYAPFFWTMLFCNVVVGQALWFPQVRKSPGLLFLVSILVNTGMWLERFVIIVTSLHRDYLPSSWGMYIPTVWDWAVFIGTLGFFVTLFLLFVRFLPVSSMFELRKLVHEENPSKGEEERDRFELEEEALERPAYVQGPRLYGLMAEFREADQLLGAVRACRRAGYEKLQAYSPFSLEELDGALGLKATRMSACVLAGALLGAVGAYLMQWYSAVYHYPYDIGARPHHSWPSFIPLTFELAVLGGATFGVLGMLAFNGLPQLYHPVFNVPAFIRASRDRFFLCVESSDTQFDRRQTLLFLETLQPVMVHEVPK